MNFKTFNEFIEENHEFSNEIQFLVNSNIRFAVFTDLVNGPAGMRSLSDTNFLSYSSISNNIHRLMDKGYVVKKDSKFYPTTKGLIHFSMLLDFSESINIVNDYSLFWQGHDIKPLLVDSLFELHVLENSQLVESVPLDIYKPHNELKNLINSSGNLKLLFPYLHPEYPAIVKDLINQGAELEILLPEDILINLIQGVGRETIQKGLDSRTLSIKYFKKELRLALAIGDDASAIGLFKNDGTYDQNRLLISKDKEAIKWTLNIFEHYKSQGLNFNSRDFNSCL